MDDKVLESSIKCEARRAFLELCSHKTRLLHDPVSNPYVVCGHPNPSGFGDAARSSQTGSWGQSSVLFPNLETYRIADKCGRAPYGGAEYGIPQTPEADAVCRRTSRSTRRHRPTADRLVLETVFCRCTKPVLGCRKLGRAFVACIASACQARSHTHAGWLCFTLPRRTRRLPRSFA